ncbi:MAG: dynamin family protein [bacterium]
MGYAFEQPEAGPVRNEASDLLARIQEICRQFGVRSLDRRIDVCRALLTRTQVIDVAILGQFKAGKSSFLNSLIGKSILPVGVVPVTTAITRLQYGKRERALVSHYDGRQTEVDCTAVEEFTSEARNPSNRKNVEVVDVELPALAKYPGLRLVDTPGLGSVFKVHMETSENWLPEVGAALLAVSADRPLGQNDLELIRGLRSHTPRIVLLLSKADLLSPSQQEEVLEFFSAALRRELHEEYPVLLYSTRTGTEHWKQRVEEEVLNPLASKQEDELRHILRHKIQSLGRDCLSYLQIALQSSLQADLDRDELRRKIFDERVNYDLMRDQLALIARENAHETRPLIKSYLETTQEPQLKNKLVGALCREIPSWRGNIKQMTRSYEEWVEESLTEEIERVSRSEQEHFMGTLRKAHASLTRSLEAFRTLLNQNVEQVLGVPLAEAEWKIEVAEPRQPDIKIGRTFDFHFDSIWFLIPMFLFRPLVEKHFMNQAYYEVEVNLSRLAAQWEERINKAIDAMKKQAIRYIQDELSTIEALLSRTQGQTGEIRRSMEALREGLERLSQPGREG